MKQHDRIYVAGRDTLIGASLVRLFARQGYGNIVGEGKEPDFTRADEVEDFFSRTAPEYVFVAAGRSAGIEANRRFPAELMHHNLLVACHVLHSAYRHGVKKLLYLASSCSYPKNCLQPMRVESLISGPLEPTSESYALAKLAGLYLCHAYRRQYGARFVPGIVADMFGPGDDFSLEGSHVVAALIRKMHEAKRSGARRVEIWGTGTPRREFIFVDDLADACIFVMREYEGTETINLGGGTALSIRELAELVKEVVVYEGELFYDTGRPDGMPAKLLDSGPLEKMCWKPKVPIKSALAATYDWFLEKACGVGEAPWKELGAV